ncbi:Uncharacterised protein [Serratia rubidaea]|nr:Uncharacterised protein [Serratia rubidaea]
MLIDISMICIQIILLGFLIIFYLMMKKEWHMLLMRLLR